MDLYGRLMSTRIFTFKCIKYLYKVQNYEESGYDLDVKLLTIVY